MMGYYIVSESVYKELVINRETLLYLCQMKNGHHTIVNTVEFQPGKL